VSALTWLTTLIGVIVGFALVSLRDWLRSRPDLTVKARGGSVFWAVETRGSLSGAQSRAEWRVCDSGVENAKLYVILDVVAINRSHLDDAIEALWFGFTENVHQSATAPSGGEFMGEVVPAHSIKHFEAHFPFPHMIGSDYDFWKDPQSRSYQLHATPVWSKPLTVTVPGYSLLGGYELGTIMDLPPSHPESITLRQKKIRGALFGAIKRRAQLIHDGSRRGSS
jgi:hypothetical protein